MTLLQVEANPEEGAPSTWEDEEEHAEGFVGQSEKGVDVIQMLEFIVSETQKEAIEAYLEKIKPGCDFITTNFDTREEYRKIEKEALEKAVELLKASPAYKAAVTKAEHEAMGDCKDICVGNEAHVTCKA